MKLLALGLLSLGLFVFIFCFEFYRAAWHSDPFLRFRPQGNFAAMPDYDYWVYPGDQGLEFYNKIEGENSIQGLRSVDDLHVDIVVLGLTGVDAATLSPYRVYENVKVRLLKPNDGWTDRMLLKGTDVSEGSINVDFKVQSMPKDEDLWGRDAKLVTTGHVSFPHKINNEEFAARDTSLREETPFRFASRTEKERYEAAYKEYQQEKDKVDAYNKRAGTIYRITKRLGFLTSALLIGSALWIFVRSTRQRRAV